MNHNIDKHILQQNSAAVSKNDGQAEPSSPALLAAINDMTAKLAKYNDQEPAAATAPDDLSDPPGDARHLRDTAWQCRDDLAREEQAGRAREDDQGATALADVILAQAQDASDRIDPPPPTRYIIKPQITEDTGVSLLIGPGGCGKSYLALTRCIAIASGRPIGKAHQTEVTAPVCFFSLEDPQNVLKRRYYYCIRAIEEHYGAFSPDQLAALDANMYRLPVRGLMGALMEMDGKGNPRKTANYDALRQIVERIKPTYVVLDTMSRALGIDENNNAHAAQWISALEEILFDYPKTVFQIVGHTGKGNYDGKNEDSSVRGASAFTWNARGLEKYSKATDEEVKKLGLEEGTEVFKLYLYKHNYSEGNENIFFTRNEHGVPIEIDVEMLKSDKDKKAFEYAVKELPRIMSRLKPDRDGARRLIKSYLCRNEDIEGQKRHKDAYKALLATGIKRDLIRLVISKNVEDGHIKEVTGDKIGQDNKHTYLELVTAPPDDEEA